MGPVTVSTVISAPPEEVFDYLQDIANHPEFTDHYLLDWHLTRIDSVGRGAGARFRVEAPANRFSWAEVTFAEVERPHLLVEKGRAGKSNRIRTWRPTSSLPSAGERRRASASRCRPCRRPSRIASWRASGCADWLRRKNQRALRRLRAILEEGAAPGAPARRSVDGASRSPVGRLPRA